MKKNDAQKLEQLIAMALKSIYKDHSKQITDAINYIYEDISKEMQEAGYKFDKALVISSLFKVIPTLIETIEK